MSDASANITSFSLGLDGHGYGGHGHDLQELRNFRASKWSSLGVNVNNAVGRTAALAAPAVKAQRVNFRFEKVAFEKKSEST